MVLQILNLKNPTEFVTATFNFDKTPERIMVGLLFAIIKVYRKFMLFLFDKGL
jgi:hypothetical protein